MQLAGIVQSPVMDSVVELQSALERARAGTEEILAPVTDEGLVEHVSPLQSPLVWELAQIAHFEELWLLQNLYGSPPLDGGHDEVSSALPAGAKPRCEAPDAPPRSRSGPTRTTIRERVLEALEHTDLDAQNPLLNRGFVFGLVLQHELQHQETMLQTLQLRTAIGYPMRDAAPPDDPSSGPDEIYVAGGPFILGATDEPWAYDNELGSHEVELEPFFIDRVPVTNAAFADFIAHRGYRSQKHWSEEGWEWRERENVTAPLFWERGQHGWERVRFGRREPLPPDEPVQHVSWYEADAFARWAEEAPPDRSRVGAGGRVARAAGQEPLPVGSRVGGLRGEPRPSALLAGARRLVRRRREPGRLPPAHRGRLGMDVVALPSLSRLSRVSVPRVLGGLLRRGVPRPARRLLGDRPARRPHELPELRLPRPAAHLRRVPLRARR